MVYLSVNNLRPYRGLGDFVADKPGGTDGKTYVVASDKIEPLSIKEIEMNKLLAQHGNGWAKLV